LHRIDHVNQTEVECPSSDTTINETLRRVKYICGGVLYL